MFMFNVLNPEISKKGSFFIYRYRFLGIYILIGVTSIILEVICYRGLERIGLYPPFSKLVGLAAGIIFAYWMNVRFNFKVPTSKRNRAFFYFVLISTGSVIITFAFKGQLEELGWTYEKARFAASGSLFLIGYMFHRKFSFVDYKKVGVAIYANGIENIKEIYKKIGGFTDFIHVDIIDQSFGEFSVDPRSYRLEVIRAYWPKKQIQVHVMSRKPSKWINGTAPFVDTILIHMEIDEDVSNVLSLIHSWGKKAGICISIDTPVEKLKPYLNDVSIVMLLTIPKPGQSNQKFDMNALYKIDEINRWEERSRFSLCIDGGVNEKNIGLLDVEDVVSGSSVLNHSQPSRQIMRLQTSSSWEKI